MKEEIPVVVVLTIVILFNDNGREVDACQLGNAFGARFLCLPLSLSLCLSLLAPQLPATGRWYGTPYVVARRPPGPVEKKNGEQQQRAEDIARTLFAR